uniref:Uncharacterized protein n=1 Tax=Oryza punctata TaxID=4537 RepID=A0A0E0M934_ORYPU
MLLRTPDIYRQKLQQFVADGELNKDEVEALMAFQVRLCIPQETVDSVHSEICGKLFEKVVVEAISSVDGYDTNRRQAVKKAAQGLNLKNEAVMTIFSKVVRKLFLNYIQRAKAAGNRIETAKELKKMISFNTVVVSELLADIKGEPTTAEAQTSDATAEPEVSESEGGDEYEWEQLETLRKTRPDKELKEKLAKSSQKEITLKDDIPLRDRAELEYAQKIIKNITTTKLSSAIEASISRGQIGIQQVRGLKEANFQLDSLIAEPLRENIYKKSVEEIFSSGTGEFDEEEVYVKIPCDLIINAEKAKSIVQEIPKVRLDNALVQAVALLRQKKKDEVVSSLNDLLACDAVVPASKPLSWPTPGELDDLLRRCHVGEGGSSDYDVMMSLYLENGQVERVHSMYQAIEKANSCNDLMTWHSYATIGKVFMQSGKQERALQAFQESEKKIAKKSNRVAYGFLLTMYADLGMNSEVDRIWDVYRSRVPASACNSMYMCRISVLLKMNDIVGAEKAYEEWESKHVYHDSRLVNLLLTAYCKDGLMEKVEALVAQFFEIGWRPFARVYLTILREPKAVDLTKYRNTLASGYFKVGQASKAVDLTKKALAYASSECIPDLTNVLLSLNYFTEQKNVEAAEEMVASLLHRSLPWVPPTRVPPTWDVYHGLLKTYVNTGKPVSDLLDRMKKDGMEADEET